MEEENKDFSFKPPTPTTSSYNKKQQHGNNKNESTTSSNSAVPDFIQKLFRLVHLRKRNY